MGFKEFLNIFGHQTKEEKDFQTALENWGKNNDDTDKAITAVDTAGDVLVKTRRGDNNNNFQAWSDPTKNKEGKRYGAGVDFARRLVYYGKKEKISENYNFTYGRTPAISVAVIANHCGKTSSLSGSKLMKACESNPVYNGNKDLLKEDKEFAKTLNNEKSGKKCVEAIINYLKPKKPKKQ